MKRFLSAVLVLMMVAALFTGCGQSSGEEAGSEVKAEKTVKMKLAWAETAEPDGHPLSAALYAFKEDVEVRTEGRVEVELFPAGQLGDAKSMINQVKEGIIQSCASIPSGLIAGSYYDNFNVFEIPYLFPTNEVAWEVIQPGAEFFNNITGAMAEETGIRPLALLLEGKRHFTNSKREIQSPADLEGLKIRTMEVPAHMKMVEALGGLPTPVSWLELYSALQTGVVDGQENPVFNIQYLKGYEVQDYLTLDGHLTLFNVWVIDDEWLAGLPEDLQADIQASVKVAAGLHREKSEAMNAAATKDLEEKGMQIYQPTPEQLEEFRVVTQEAVIPYIQENVTDASLIDTLQEAIEAAQ